MATYTKLDSYTVGAGGAASVTFSNITQAYTDLVIKITARTASYASNPDLAIYINGNGYPNTSSYNRNVFGNGTSAASNTAGTGGYINLGPVNGTSTTANTFCNTEVYITNYNSNTAYKTLSIDNALENNATAGTVLLGAGLNTITNPITSISIDCGNTLAQYSTFTLYGVYKGAETTISQAPTIGTATAGDTSASVAFTAPATTDNIASYVATSTPGSITGSGTSSPVTVSGLTNGTSYTFKVKAVNPAGYGPESSASNSVTPVSMAFESIATATVGSGGTSNITFSSIPSTYTHLQIRGIGKSTNTVAGQQDLQMRFNADATSSYVAHKMYGNGTSALDGWSGTTTYVQLGNSIPTSASGETGLFNSIVIDILDYANTNKYKTTRAIYGWDKNGSGQISFATGLWMNTGAINQIVLTPDTLNIAQYSSFALYGIKGA